MSNGFKSDQDIKTAIEKEFSSRQAILLQEVKMCISDALKTDQRVILISDTKKEEKKSRAWDVTQIIVPVILTGFVGFGVWYTQNSLSNKITATNQAVSTRYVLTQEYYKERFKVYQRIYERLSAVESAFRVVQEDPNERMPAIEAKEKLDEELARSEIYFSPDILGKLNDISFVAAQLPTVNPKGTGKLSELTKRITAIKQDMYVEVSGDMGQLPSQKP